MNPENDKRLFLIDAFALIYRSYFAFIKNPIRNSKGIETSAAYGFTNTLNELIKKEQPTHIAVVFDAPEQTDRAVEHEFYKAHREAMPDGIRDMLPYIKNIVKAFNVPMYELAGYEADDIIGTIAKEKEKEGYTVFMVTPDKDFAQLVSENIFMYKPGRKGGEVEIIGIPEVKEKWEVEDPLQVIDILGMWGDSADNIPGIPGVGEKTAKKFIKEFGSMEGLFANTDKLKGKMKEKVEANKEKGIISKQLATIILDVPITVEDKDLNLEKPDFTELGKLFAELEFNNLAKRILGTNFDPSTFAKKGDQMSLFGEVNNSKKTPATETIEIANNFENIESIKPNYIHLKDEKDINALIEAIKKQKSFAFDTETTGLDSLNAEIVGISFCLEKNKAYYLPIELNRAKAKERLAIFKTVLEDETIEKIGQNLKYDIHILLQYGIEVKQNIFDTMLAHYLIEPDGRHNMDALAKNYLNYETVSIETLIGKKGKNQLTFDKVDIEKQVKYAAEDADITYQLAGIFKTLLKEKELEKLYQELEIPLVDVLTQMEEEGINIDTDFLDNYAAELTLELNDFKSKIIDLAGVSFNLDSPKQLGEVLFDKMGIKYKGKKTKTGQYSTSEDKLQTYKKDNEIVEYILEYRQLAKLLSTYVLALPKLKNEKTGRVHSTFSQAVAATGRLSSNNPNLQNIPIRTARGRKVREAFVPRNEEYILLAADYSQIELRLIAELSKDEVMLEAFNQGEDIHATTASKVFKVALEDVTRAMRSNAKLVNFGIIYGVSAFGLSQQTDLSRTESKQIIEAYFETYPSIKKYMDDNIAFARENGFVKTIMGRKRILKDIISQNAIVRGHAERNAINSPIQGSAADMIKVAMIDIQEELNKRQLKSKMLLQVHDELVFDIYKPELEEMKLLIKEKMENAIPDLSVPIIAEMGTGENWLVAH
ncbi:MAG: DNA polymerase I [Chitinophagales bacterium]